MKKRCEAPEKRIEEINVMSTEYELQPVEELQQKKSTEIENNKSNFNSQIASHEINSQKGIIKNFSPFLGALWIFLHTVFIQFIAIIVKKVSYVSISQLSLIRYTGIFVASLPLAICCTNQILGERRSRGYLLLRAFLSVTGLIFQIATFRYIELVQASIVMSTLPFATAILARIILKESLGVVQTISLIITICGVLLSVRLPEMLFHNNFQFDSQHLIGYATAIAFVLCMSASNVTTRKLKKIHFSIVMLYSGFIGIIENSALTAIFPFIPAECGWDHILCALIALFGIGAKAFIIVALQREPAGLVAVQKSSFEILVMTVFQIIFFHKYPDWYAAGGAFLVLVSLTIIGIKNCVQMLPETSEKRQRLRWILL